MPLLDLEYFRDLFQSKTKFQYFLGLGVFSWFCSRKRLCSNTFWTLNISMGFFFLNLRHFHGFVWENYLVQIFFQTWKKFNVLDLKYFHDFSNSKWLSPAKYWYFVVFSIQTMKIYRVQKHIGTWLIFLEKSRKIFQVQEDRFFSKSRKILKLGPERVGTCLNPGIGMCLKVGARDVTFTQEDVNGDRTNL